MIAGHFGLAAAVKSQARTVPVWSLMLATVWLDIVFVPLFFAGVETMQTVPGTAGGFGQVILHAVWTHSLVGALVLSAIFGLGAARVWGRFAGWVLAGVSFSHWLLDLIVHRADMPILPANWGGLPNLGFGLWALPRVTIGLESVLVVAGAWAYWRAAAAAERAAGASGGRATLTAGSIALGGLAILGYQATMISP